MARLLEFEAKALLRAAGVATPKGRMAPSVEDAVAIASEIGFPVVLKAQIPVGKRGKAGGILFAQSEDEAYAQARALFGKVIYGFPVTQVLDEQKLEIKDEHYLAILSNPATKTPTLIFARNGGMDVEEQAASGAEGLVTFDIDIIDGLRPYMALDTLVRAGVSGRALPAIAQMAVRLYAVYRQHDCVLVEVNPLALTARGLLAADARISVDDDSLFRHPDLGLDERGEVGDRERSPLELVAAQIDAHDHRGSAHFVQIDPDGSLAKAEGKISIGFDGVGTGVSLATMDELVPLGFLPRNFCDTSGNPTASKLYRITKVILSQPDLEGYVFVSCLSSQQLDNTARGIVKAFLELYPDRKPNIPCVFCFRGAWDETAIAMFDQHGLTQSPLVQVLGRDASERDVALAFRDLHARWRDSNRAGALA